MGGSDNTNKDLSQNWEYAGNYVTISMHGTTGTTATGSTHGITGKTATESVHRTTKITVTGSTHGSGTHTQTDGQVTRQSNDKRAEHAHGWADNWPGEPMQQINNPPK